MHLKGEVTFRTIQSVFFKLFKNKIRKGRFIMDYKLKDKVVLITGATGGIGQALTRAFVSEGCKLAISSTKQEKLDAFVPTLDIAPNKLKTFIADVTKEEDVKAFVEGAAAYFGCVDVMVINAGYEGSAQFIQDATIENYMKVYNINVFASMYCMKYAAQEMLKQESGAIVTIASNGSYTTAPGMGAYCSSKHAVAGLAKSVALELGPHGIHCNYICPGGVETPMIHRIEENIFGDSKTHEECEQMFSAQYLDGRYCKPEEVANLALYLASEVSSHIMGSGIRLDAGMDALC
jgi:NAD(P)-dependent dehydrogenase (short-subunit alcohol dehydrogenase family)